MSSLVNKITNKVTNASSSIIGRGNMTKLTNSLNQSLFVKSKYRDFMKQGNVIQLISKSSHMSLQITKSPNDPNRLILSGNGQVGTDFINAHFIVEKDPKSGHLKFKNFNNFLAFDQDIPCILSDAINPKDKYQQMRTRNEFRLHELLGEDEYFTLESVYYPGRYLAVMPDGSITHSRDKSLEITHFCIHLIYDKNSSRPESTIVTSPSSTANAATNPLAINTNDHAAISAGATASNRMSEKEQEAQQALRNQPTFGASTSNNAEHSFQANDEPPSYTNLYPKLP
jgi:hypothetical protein